MTDLDEFLICK